MVLTIATLSLELWTLYVAEQYLDFTQAGYSFSAPPVSSASSCTFSYSQTSPQAAGLGWVMHVIC